MPNINNFFDPTDPEVGDNTGAWLRAKDGSLIEAFHDALSVQETITNKLRFETSFVDVSYAASASYQNMYTYSGSGLLYGFLIRPDTDKLQVRLTVDGEIVTQDISVKNIRDTLGDVRLPFSGNFLNASNADYWNFTTPQPINYASSVVIDVKKSDNGAFKTRDYVIILTKET